MTKGDDTIRFEEAGITFEIFGRDAMGERRIAVSDATGVVDGIEVADWPETCRAVDAWLDKHLAKDAPGRFGGFRILLRDHETLCEEEAAYLTRGELLGWFDFGNMPTMDELIDLAECAGDSVLEVRDGAGNLLIERRDAVDGPAPCNR